MDIFLISTFVFFLFANCIICFPHCQNYKIGIKIYIYIYIYIYNVWLCVCVCKKGKMFFSTGYYLSSLSFTVHQHKIFHFRKRNVKYFKNYESHLQLKERQLRIWVPGFSQNDDNDDLLFSFSLISHRTRYFASIPQVFRWFGQSPYRSDDKFRHNSWRCTRLNSSTER